jgi:hypothetical protein
MELSRVQKLGAILKRVEDPAFAARLERVLEAAIETRRMSPDNQPKGPLAAHTKQMPVDSKLFMDGSGPSPALTSPVGTRYGGNIGEQFGEELANQFRPSDGTTEALLGRAERLNLLRETTEVPEDRYAGGWARGDQLFQLEATKLVDDGVIGPGALVISNTGHDIPVMAALMKKLDMSGVLNVPDFQDLDIGNGARVAGQAETWGDEIASLNARNGADGSVSSYFIGIDTHRNALGEAGRFDATLLPDVEELKAAGVDRIVYLAEAAVGPADQSQVSSDLQPYFAKLEAAGIEIVLRGVDSRQVRR